MQIYYTDEFVLPLPEGHRFPMAKYALLRRRIAESGIVQPDDLRIPRPAADEDLLLVHDCEYVNRVVCGSLTREEIRRIGFPWSPGLVERSRRSVGATIEACRAAMAEGIAVSLAGGTHHAFADRGEGFCVFNDTAVAARVLQAEAVVTRVLVVDCDVHQGNGTAAIFADDPSVFTLDVCAAHNFPFSKEAGDIVIALEDGTTDVEYLRALHVSLTQALELFCPDLAIYLAGADPFEGDRLGRLSLSKQGLSDRDHTVLGLLRDRDIPVAITMSGGYAPRIADTVDIHFQTVRAAAGLRLSHATYGNSRVRRLGDTFHV